MARPPPRPGLRNRGIPCPRL